MWRDITDDGGTDDGQHVIDDKCVTDDKCVIDLEWMVELYIAHGRQLPLISSFAHPTSAPTVVCLENG